MRLFGPLGRDAAWGLAAAGRARAALPCQSIQLLTRVPMPQECRPHRGQAGLPWPVAASSWARAERAPLPPTLAKAAPFEHWVNRALLAGPPGRTGPPPASAFRSCVGGGAVNGPISHSWGRRRREQWPHFLGGPSLYVVTLHRPQPRPLLCVSAETEPYCKRFPSTRTTTERGPAVLLKASPVSPNPPAPASC